MQKLRYYHRWATLVIALFTLFLGVTGSMMQMIDLRSILTHAPATDGDVRAMRESFDGPEDFQVRETSDYLAQALPSSFDFTGALPRLITSARRQLGTVPFRYVEFRMAGAEPIGRVGLDKTTATFDAATGRLVGQQPIAKIDIGPPVSPRNFFKHLHRMTTFGDWALIINLIVAVGLPVLIVTGVWIYFKLLLGRKKIKRDGAFWSGGGMWRETHRWISVLAAGLLLGVAFSGGWLAIESAGLAIFMRTHMPHGVDVHGPPPPPPPPRALSDAALSKMLDTTLNSAKAAAGADPIKVLRLRNYAQYAQGVVVTGGGNSQQLVYNARTGRAMSETEPGYPRVPFPFGWQAHQFAKSLHRGDFIGLSGRWMNLLAGFSLIYLSLSGLVMYWQMWRKRRNTGRKKLIWA